LPAGEPSEDDAVTAIDETELHTPEGIRFECTGCGNCCLAWPVPVTRDDYERIAALDGSALASFPRLFREFQSPESKLEAFTHTLEKRGDGRCEFLTEDNRCWLHRNYGPTMKPAMCQLFPYTFTETPSGVYASVSFASTGTLLNAGHLLSEQGELLAEKWRLFRRLFPRVAPDWSHIQLIDGYRLDWHEYLSLERELLRIVTSQAAKRVEKRLLDCDRFLVRKVPPGTDLEKHPPMEARPKVVDQLIVRHLFDFYVPDDVFACGIDDLDTQAMLKQLVESPPAVQLRCLGAECSFRELNEFAMGSLDPQSEDLLSRFVYCRIFSKLYFGAGFAGLSLLAGLHHLTILIALIRFKAKIMTLRSNGQRPDFLAVAEMVRALERRLTQVAISRQTATVLEVLLTSPSRVERIVSLAY
jgi:Fe-S-cluster containining protein